MSQDPHDALAAELDAYLADEDHPLPDEDDFVPIAAPDEATVDRMLRRRHRLLTERGRVTDVASAEVRRIREWESDRTAGVDRQLVWLDRGLEMFARQALPARNLKSLPLPNGTLKLTQPGAPSVVVTDLSDFVAWCTDEAHPERDALLRRTVDVEKADAKRAFRVGPEAGPGELDEQGAIATTVFYAMDDDEIVPGLRFTKPAHSRFSVVPPAQNAGIPEQQENEQ